jgi:hypothetical protein
MAQDVSSSFVEAVREPPGRIAMRPYPARVTFKALLYKKEPRIEKVASH